MSEDRRSWDSSQFRKYDLNLEQIPRLDHNDPLIDDLIKQNVCTQNVCCA